MAMLTTILMGFRDYRTSPVVTIEFPNPGDKVIYLTFDGAALYTVRAVNHAARTITVEDLTGQQSTHYLDYSWHIVKE